MVVNCMVVNCMVVNCMVVNCMVVNCMVVNCGGGRAQRAQRRTGEPVRRWARAVRGGGDQEIRSWAAFSSESRRRSSASTSWREMPLVSRSVATAIRVTRQAAAM